MDSRTSNRARHGLTGLGDVRFSGKTVRDKLPSPADLPKAIAEARAAGHAEGVREERERAARIVETARISLVDDDEFVEAAMVQIHQARETIAAAIRGQPCPNRREK